MKKIGNFAIKRLSLIWYLSVIFLFVLLIYITFGGSLHFPLWGDDWFMLLIVKNYYGPGNQFPYLSLKGYFQPWGVMNLFLIINRYFFGYSGYGYYLVSMILRTVGAFTGYLFLSKFTKSKFMGLMGSLFVLIGYTGIESTNYTVHMNTYLVIIFLFLALNFLIDSYKNNFGKFLLGCLFFALSLAASPLRSHGLLPFIIVFDILYSLTIIKVNFKQILFRQVCFVVSALIIWKLGFFGYVNFSFINISLILQMARNGDYTFISAFITTLGKTFFPDLYIINVTNVVRLFGINWFKWVLAIGFLIETLLFWFLSKITRQGVKNYFIVFYITIFNFFAIFLIFRRFFRSGELLSNLMFTFIGVFFLGFLLWALYMLFLSKKEKITAGWVGMVAGPVLILTSLMVPLLFTPGRVLESNHRYLTLSLVGVAITIVSLLKLVIDNKKIAFFISVFLLLLLTLNIKADRKYFSDLYLTRSSETSNFIWDQFFKFMPQNYPNKLLLFYFDDSENVRLASDAFLYGFPSRVGLKYNIPTYGDLPAYTNIYNEVISVVTDGKAFRRLGYPEKKISVDQVYAFKFTKNGDLVDITKETREDLILETIKHE